MNKFSLGGFTLIELLVAISIIGLLSTILYASFGESRAQTRDKMRMSSLKELQLAIEQYKAQVGSYPLSSTSCPDPNPVNNNLFYGPGPVSGGVTDLSSCITNASKANYIAGLIPSYAPKLPFDQRFELEDDRGFYYRSDGFNYKLMLRDAVEVFTVSSYDDEFARCPRQFGAGPCSGAAPPATTYAVYSPGAESW